MRAVALVMALLLTACASGDADGPTVDARGLVPTFPPTSVGATPTTPVPAPAASVLPQDATPTTGVTATNAVPVVDSAPPAPASPASATIVDATGDVTEAAPRWADLAGATLTRHAEYIELRVTLGDVAPRTSGADGRTMNVASFYDVDGDGAVDYEVWVNLASGGWSGSWFDDRSGVARYGDDASVGITIQGRDLIVRFPPGHLGGSESFRWSLASEYGTYAELGTASTARDDAPDGDAAAPFPA